MINETQMMHGENWRGQDLTGWIATEKHRGCRAYWDGSRLWSRGGDIIEAPAWFTKGLPTGTPLDCEVWCGYDVQAENRAKLAVRYGKFEPDAQLIVFDRPAPDAAYRLRLKSANALVLGPFKNPAHGVVVPVEIKNVRHALKLMEYIHSKGGEGLVCYEPSAPYSPGRTCNVLKVKE